MLQCSTKNNYFAPPPEITLVLLMQMSGMFTLPRQSSKGKF